MEFFSKLILSLNINFFIFVLVATVCVLVFLFWRRLTGNVRRKEAEILEKFTELSESPIIVFSHNHEIVFSNPPGKKILGITNERSLKKLEVMPEFKINEKWIDLPDLIDRHTNRSHDRIEKLLDATLRVGKKETPVTLRMNDFFAYEDKRHSYIGLAITELSEQYDVNRAYYEHVDSGLPNYHKAIADIGIMVNKMQTEKRKFATIAMSIDNLPLLTSTLGYRHSREVLANVAKYFYTFARALNLAMYHMSDGEFVILAKDVKSDQAVFSLIDKFRKNISRLYKEDEMSMHLTFSSGVSLFPDNAGDDLLNSAYQALAKAYKQGEGHVVICEKSKRLSGDAELALHNEMHHALKGNQFVVYYQPIADAETQEIVGAEALLRWEHPSKGVISPDIFIPIAEKTGYIIDIGEYVADKVIKQLGLWDSLGFKKTQIAINVSLRELESKYLAESLDKLLVKYDVEPEQVKVEITENIAVSNTQESHRQFMALKKLGVEISLDDFGTGHSSFAFLQNFPVDTVKIDKSFVLNIVKNQDHQVIVKAMTTMAHTLGPKVIAEGVESEKAAEMLALFGCDYLQGYYFGKPMQVFEFQEMIRK